jgi:hypothetical protein
LPVNAARAARIRLLPVLAGAIAVLASGCTAVAPTARAAGGPLKAHLTRPFPDFGFLPAPKDYAGPVFQLSQQYPATLAATQPPFMNTDFKTDWKKYILEVRDYCLEGNTETDWRVENNSARRWYHMPFQHWGPHAREGIHGLTLEAPIAPLQLAREQSARGQAYAVAIYNDRAAFTIGQVWGQDDPAEPFHDVAFQDGATVCKPLFIELRDADNVAEQVPSLTHPVLWTAFVAPTPQDPLQATPPRQPMKVALLQLDIMVRDSRSPTGWVMGTFQYNGGMNRANPWHNLVPVGLMWGNDEAVTDDKYTNPEPSSTHINPALKDTMINADIVELPATHLGWNGRLNGPLDNAHSSCISCHMTAQYPQGSNLSPLFDSALSKRYAGANAKNVGDATWMRWFRTLPHGTPFDAGNAAPDPSRVPHTTDFNLQLAGALQSFEDWQYQDGEYAADWLAHRKPEPASGPAAATPYIKNHAKPVTRAVPGSDQR